MTLGEKLKSAREKAGKTRRQAAELLGIPYNTLSNYENDARDPGSNFLKKFAKLFDTTVDDLLGINEAFAEFIANAKKLPEPEPEENTLSDEEWELVDLWREAPSEGKEAVLLLLHGYQNLEKRKTSTETAG